MDNEQTQSVGSAAYNRKQMMVCKMIKYKDGPIK